MKTRQDRRLTQTTEWESEVANFIYLDEIIKQYKTNVSIWFPKTYPVSLFLEGDMKWQAML